MLDMHIMRFTYVLLVMAITATLLTGCITVNQLIPIGPDTYSITATGEDAGTFGNGDRWIGGERNARLGAFSRATEKCQALGKALRFLSGRIVRKDGLGTAEVPYIYFYTLKFICE